MIITKRILILLAFGIWYFGLCILPAHAQCAMCKAVVESNLQGGGQVGGGLNPAILYLMSVPYIAVGLGLFFWYRSKKPAVGK